MGPLIDEDGNSLCPTLFETIVKERYIIAKKANISYSDTGDMSVLERKLLIKFITEELEAQNKAMAEAKASRKG